jgi:hypothetical protein
VQGGYGALFAVQVQVLLSITRVAVQVFKMADKLSRYCYLLNSTCAVSRHKLSRSQKFITVQDFNCVQMSVSGCKNHNEFVLGAEAKAKSVTNNLPILSVL